MGFMFTENSFFMCDMCKGDQRVLVFPFLECNRTLQKAN